MQKLRPLDDRVFVRVSSEDSIEFDDGLSLIATAGGIYLMDDENSELKLPKPAEVIAVGSGRLDYYGKRIPIEVQVGQMVWIKRHAGIELEIDGEKLLSIQERDILLK